MTDISRFSGRGIEEIRTEVRLQVYLAHAGVASRRACENLITDGRVSVNGQIVTILGTKVNEGDVVRVDEKQVSAKGPLRYVLLNKPPEFICAASDPQGRRLAIDLLPSHIKERLYSVGRLDYRSSGLIIFTNDGDFTAKVSHPSSRIEKEYLVEASGRIPDMVIENFLRGVATGEGIYHAKNIERINRETIRVVLIEGKNREIRKVFSLFHLHPILIHRIRIGNILSGPLLEGATRPLSETERVGLLALATGGKNEKY
ncbi:MAG: rRNA pseudouridine synthase [Treponema sp.]|jgi:23S rRNA pseudouridine2605 synthase|nr:rRNA pseudouridine synthase [Treponema sp.]